MNSRLQKYLTSCNLFLNKHTFSFTRWIGSFWIHNATYAHTHNITHTNTRAIMNASLSLIIFLLLTPCSHCLIFTSLSFCPDYTTRSYTRYIQTHKHILIRTSNVGRQLEFLYHLICIVWSVIVDLSCILCHHLIFTQFVHIHIYIYLKIYMHMYIYLHKYLYKYIFI